MTEIAKHAHNQQMAFAPLADRSGLTMLPQHRYGRIGRSGAWSTACLDPIVHWQTACRAATMHGELVKGGREIHSDLLLVRLPKTPKCGTVAGTSTIAPCHVTNLCIHAALYRVPWRMYRPHLESGNLLRMMHSAQQYTSPRPQTLNCKRHLDANK